jgi:Flp pilus assembly protein TadD
MSDKRKRCERCGEDLTLYRKIMKASNMYYNNGLERAKVRDLSGAVSSLLTSLELNKANTSARNLLGLIYYEMGETVAALSEWVISKHFQPEKNDADDYINAVQSNPTKLDSLNQTIKRYNTALMSAKQGNDDLAIIQLKKVTSLNPHFIRAFQLLALLYMKSGEKEKARKCLYKIAKIDVSNTTTLRYLRELDPPTSQGKETEEVAEKEDRGITAAIMPISSYKEDKPNIMAFVNLVIGVIIGVAVMAFLVVPTIKSRYQAEQNSSYVDYSSEQAKQEEKEKTIKQLQQDKDVLQQKVDQLQSQIDGIQIPEDNPALYDGLFAAVNSYISELSKPKKNDRDFTAVADQLAAITNDSNYKTDVSKNLLEALRTATYPDASDLHYSQGHEFYSEGKYEEAIAELQKAVTFDPADVSAIYFIARSYHRLEDKANAKLYYNIVISDYPDTERAKTAKDFMKELQDE